MNDLVVNYLKKSKPKEDIKLILDSRLTPKRKVIFLDRQVIKYFIDFEKYTAPEIIAFREKFLKDFDRSGNTISIMSAFYEGGSGDFENESQKRNKAFRDLKGLSGCFKHARTDEDLFFKRMKSATHAFTLDSGVLERDVKYEAIIRKTYSYYLGLLDNEFNGTNVIAISKKLKLDMDLYNVCVGNPIAQYCFSLLTNYQNARKIFKVKGLKNKSDEDIQKIIYNSYADLRVFLFMQEFKSHLPGDVELCFVSNDKALNQFNEEFKGSVQKLLIQKDKLKRISNIFNVKINFSIFNSAIFKNNEFEEFKQLFHEWGG